MLSEEILSELEKYIVNPYGFVLLAGKNGLGKTFCALNVYERLARFKLPAHDYEDARFISQTDLNILWSKKNAEWGHASDLIEELARCKFLVLDDLGTRAPSVAFMDFLYSVADKRYFDREIKGTIITTNLTSQKIREQFGDPFFSRVASGLVFKFSGEDRRFAELGF